MPSNMHISKPYLLAYNTLGAILWLRILLTLCFLTSHPSSSSPLTSTIYTTLEPQTRWAQTLAIADVLHAAAGTPPSS